LAAYTVERWLKISEGALEGTSAYYKKLVSKTRIIIFCLFCTDMQSS